MQMHRRCCSAEDNTYGVNHTAREKADPNVALFMLTITTRLLPSAGEMAGWCMVASKLSKQARRRAR